jgi:predicted transcriptional regulator
MTRCKVCTHPDRDEYERKIATKELTMSAAAEAIGCNKSAVSRHISNCFPKKVAEWVKPEATKEETLNVVDELVNSYIDLSELCDFSCRLKTPDAVRAFGERRKHLEFIAKLTGQLP